MKHLGDIAKIHGGDIAPVDVITFGSPCQDLSVAGGQKGMKYICTACGVEFAITAGAASCPMCGTEIEKTRSGLFIEAVRIIKEMRKKTNGKQPRFAVWENVPGAFSSNKGADFQIVLLELCRVTEPKAPAIAVPKGGWPNAGCLTDVGGGSIAWRTLDAQFHGVPQRRRRIILVCDFAGQCAGQLLFKPSGLPGYPAEGVCKGQAPAGAAAVRADYAGEPIGFAYKASGTAGSVAAAVNTAPTLLSARHDAAIRAQVFCKGTRGRFKGDAPTYKPADVANTLNTFDTGETRANELVVCEQPAKPFCLQGSMIGRADRNGPQGNGVNEDVSFTLNTTDRHAVVIENHPQDSRVSIRKDGTVQTLTGQMGTGGGECAISFVGGVTIGGNAVTFKENAPALLARDYKDPPTLAFETPTGGESMNTTYTVRRLTPTECARLQGFPDWWADLPQLEDMTDEAFSFWQEVRATHAAINGKTYKPVSKRQMVKWYNKLHTDSAEYKMWGNGVALPVVRIPLHGMAQLGAKTMGSLFDGSGGFPLAGLLDGIETLWASEIEPYPIAVTAWNFGGRAQVLLGGVHRNE